MAAEADVIRLVHRADWARLSLAAEVNDGSRLLLAPGRRYREQSEDGVSGCDGERPWRLPALDEDRGGHWISGPEPPLPMLLCPAWLLRSSRLEVLGHVIACGRDALHVVATERPGIGQPVTPVRAGRTEALVDAELGILLSLTSYLGGQPVRRYELRDISGPASPGDFRVHLPPALRVEQELSLIHISEPTRP